VDLKKNYKLSTIQLYYKIGKIKTWKMILIL
jgi:hypothetical protein